MNQDDHPDLSQLKVLLFDEDRSRLRYVLSALRMCGVRQVLSAGRLNEALQYLIAETCDLILLTHIGKAEQSGRLLEELKGIKATAAIPRVAITDNGAIHNLLSITAKGVDKILVLPLTKQTVEDRLAEAALKRQRTQPWRRDLIRARQLAGEGCCDQAERIYHRLMAEQPALIDACLGLHELEAAQGREEAAAGYLDRAYEAAKAISDRTEQHQQLARVIHQYGHHFLRCKEPDKAEKHYRAAIQLNPYALESFKSLLELMQKQNRLFGVMEIIELAEQWVLPYSAPAAEFAGCIEQAGRRFLQMGLTEEGQQVFERLLQWRHEDSAIHLRLADHFLDRKRYSSVLRHLITASERAKDVGVLNRIVDILLLVHKSYMDGEGIRRHSEAELGFFDRMSPAELLALASKWSRQAMMLEPDHLPSCLNLLRCHLRAEEPSEAAKLIKAIKQLCGTHETALVHFIETLIEEGTTLTALKECAEARKRFPQSPAFFRLEARAYQANGKTQEAVTRLKNGLAMRADDPELILDLAGITLETGQVSEALGFYKQAAKLLPNDRRIQQGMQQALQAMPCRL